MSATQSIPSRSPLGLPLRELRGVGPERQAQLNRLGLFTVEDLLLHRPRRHEDRRHSRVIAELTLNEPSTTRGKIVALGEKRYRAGTRSIFEIILDDGTARLHCRWWNLPFMQNYFAAGDEVFVFGRPNNLKPRTIDHPETEVIEGREESFIHINRIAPVYPLTEGMPQRWLRSLIWRALEQFGPVITEPWPELLKPGLAEKSGSAAEYRRMPSRARAAHALHFPESMAELDAARRRLALDEFLGLQRDIQSRRKNFEAKARALPCPGDNRLMKPFLRGLGFRLTQAQTRVLRELRRDLSGGHPMRRLLQGDVGSGKTVVAACSAFMALESGFNVAFMAPTEILAEQHFQTFGKWFEPLGVVVQLRTGSYKSEDTNVKGDGRNPKSAYLT
ncbi:MAG TPA: DEAD/DEAH box helicase, partial [Verrucomicrobiae bacterium]|nr:DEAD/DEAH box helicase [Verrucomicrobiae bacterium]